MTEVGDEALAAMGLSRETAIRRDASGRWWSGPDRVEHPGVVRAFDRWLERGPDGRFRLRNTLHWVYVQVEGPGQFVRSLAIDGECIRVRLAGGVEATLDPATLRQGPDGALYCDVGEGALVARFDRAAAMQLEPLLVAADGDVVVELAGRRYAAPLVEDPLEARVRRHG